MAVSISGVMNSGRSRNADRFICCISSSPKTVISSEGTHNARRIGPFAGALVRFVSNYVHLYSTRLPQVSGRQLTDRAGARHGNFTPPRISPSSPHCVRLWLGRSIITRLLTRVVSGSAELEHNARQPATGCFVDGWNRSAPYWAVMDADLVCTGGLGASSSVASASPSGASRQRTYPVAGSSIFKEQKRAFDQRYSQCRANWARMLFMV